MRDDAGVQQVERCAMTVKVQSRGWRHRPWRLLLWGVPTALLLTPAVMMVREAGGWQWSAFDFAFAAVLLYGTTGLIDLAIRKAGSTAYRLGAGLAALTAFVLLWINGAVGVIGSEDNPANLVFFGVILVALAGSVLARFEAKGMARAMLAACGLTAAVMAAVPVFAWGADERPGAIGLMMLIGGFALMWGLSSALFAKAARDGAHG
jgi:hypothetical protein